MGFWDTAGELAKKAGNFAYEETKKAKERAKEYENEMPNKSDSQLLSIVRTERLTSPLRAGIAYKELKNRGYDPKDIN